MEIEYIYKDGDKSLIDGSLQRKSVISCPYCEFSYPDYLDIKYRCDYWYNNTEKLMQIIIQDYRCKRDGVILLSRCVSCGNMSWVHRSFYSIRKDIFSYGIIDIEKLRKEEDERIDFAYHEWDNSLCKTCKFLTHTNKHQRKYYMYGVWVDCIQRYAKLAYSGEPKTKCKHYKELK